MLKKNPPKTAREWYLVGLRHAEQKNYEAAMEAFEKATTLDPKFVAAWNNLGITRRERKDLVGVIGAFARALAIDPNDTAARHNLERAKNEHNALGGLRDRERLEKLKKLVRVSKKLKINQIGEYLDLAGKDLFDKLVDWAAEFGFTIDEDTVEFGTGGKEDFIAELERAFAGWEKSETKAE